MKIPNISHLRTYTYFNVCASIHDNDDDNVMYNNREILCVLSEWPRRCCHSVIIINLVLHSGGSAGSSSKSSVYADKSVFKMFIPYKEQ